MFYVWTRDDCMDIFDYIMYSTLCINQCILGRNEAGQLGHGNVTRVDNPTEVSALDGLNIIYVAIGKQHTLFVTGKVFWASQYLQLVGRLQWASERYFSASLSSNNLHFICAFANISVNSFI